MQIGSRSVGPGEPTYVIAEAGINHDGNLDTARGLVEAAAETGADAVKFQTFEVEQWYAPDSGPYREAMAELAMPSEWIPELAAHARKHGVHFLSTPFDRQSVDELDEHLPAFKIASFTLSDHQFLRYVARKGKPIVASTGIHTREEISEAVDVLRDAGAEFALLHCVSSYPTPLDEINVRAVAALSEEFAVPVGFSDHTENPTIAPCAAVALGASIVEKHITLDNSLDGADHAFSLEPDAFGRMATAIRDTERALGTGELGISDVEQELYDVARRFVQATDDLCADETLSRDDLAARRPGDRNPGVKAKNLDSLIGQTLVTDVERGEGITWDHIK